MLIPKRKVTLPEAKDALPGRTHAMPIINRHYVNGNPIAPPYPEYLCEAIFGMGCFWGAERKFWQTPNIYSTAVGYSGGLTPNLTYDELCTGMTGHNEVVKVIYDPKLIDYGELLKIFWESHNPTQGMRQGNDIGTQYRSAIYTTSEEQFIQAQASKANYQLCLQRAGVAWPITTEILMASAFYYAEDYHQQYLAKEPMGYCGVGGIGVGFEWVS